MANFNNPNLTGVQQPGNYPGQQPVFTGQPQNPQQFGYGNSIVNSQQYDYMGRYNNPQQNITFNNHYFKCIPVSSKEEAKGCQIDLDGSLWVFTDIGNGRIYTKQVTNNGTSDFKTYAQIEEENPQGSTQYVTKDEFNKVIQALMAAMANNTNKEESNQQNNDASANKQTLINF